MGSIVTGMGLGDGGTDARVHLVLTHDEHTIPISGRDLAAIERLVGELTPDVIGSTTVYRAEVVISGVTTAADLDRVFERIVQEFDAAHLAGWEVAMAADDDGGVQIVHGDYRDKFLWQPEKDAGTTG